MIRAYVDFSKKIRMWDGFGITIESDFNKLINKPEFFQQYFNQLNEENRNKTINFLFSDEGLHISLVKLTFNLSDFGPSEENNNVNLSRENIDLFKKTFLTFYQNALDSSKQWGGNLKLLTTFLNPPYWMAKQKDFGIELNPTYRTVYAQTIIEMIKLLIENDVDVYGISFHFNGKESESVQNKSNSTSFFWSPELVVDFIKLLRRTLDNQNLNHIVLTSGETYNLARFYDWGYADSISEDPNTLASIGLIASNVFEDNLSDKTILNISSAGIDSIREKKTDIHAWITSLPNRPIDATFLSYVGHLIYHSKVNAIFISNSLFADSYFSESSSETNLNIALEPINSYYYIKVLTRAGQPGMSVCQVALSLSDLRIIAFAGNGTRHHDSFVIINHSTISYDVSIEIRGSSNESFSVYRTSSFENDKHMGAVRVKEGMIHYSFIPLSVTAFYGYV